MTKVKMKGTTEGVVGGNVCTMCLYNIPRASLMITLPALVILVSGAAMTAFIEPGQSWTDGMALIALVLLILGGAWTLGGLVFWLVAWWRLKPKSRPRNNRSHQMVSAGHDNLAVQLEGVTSLDCDVSADGGTTSKLKTSDQEREVDVKTGCEEVDRCDPVRDEESIHSVL